MSKLRMPSLQMQIAMVYRMNNALRKYGNERDFQKFIRSLNLDFPYVLFSTAGKIRPNVGQYKAYATDYQVALPYANNKPIMPILVNVSKRDIHNFEPSNLTGDSSIDANRTNYQDEVDDLLKRSNYLLVNVVDKTAQNGPRGEQIITYVHNSSPKVPLDGNAVVEDFKAFMTNDVADANVSSGPKQPSLFRKLLRGAGAAALAALGFKAIKKFFGFEMLMMIPTEYGNMIPNDMVVYDFNGKPCKHKAKPRSFAKGYLPYGVMVPFDASLEQFCFMPYINLHATEDNQMIQAYTKDYLYAIEQYVLPVPEAAIPTNASSEREMSAVLTNYVRKSCPKIAQHLAYTDLEAYRDGEVIYITFVDNDGIRQGVELSSINDMCTAFRVYDDSDNLPEIFED